MIKNFGKFKRGELSEENGFKFFPMFNENGEDFHLDIVKSESSYDGPNFIDSVMPFYAAVRPDHTIRVVSNEPSRVQPDDGEWFIGSDDEELKMGQVYDPETNEVHTPEVVGTHFVRAGDLWERLTDDEAEQVEAAIATQPVRTQNIFRARTEYHSDHELFPLLTQIATQLFGEERASEILAPST